MFKNQFTASENISRSATMRTLLLAVIIALAAVFSANAQIIISQYIEAPAGNFPKGIELWNASSNTVDFSVTPLDVNVYANGAVTPNAQQAFNLSAGTLQPGGVLVLGTSTFFQTYMSSLGYSSNFYPVSYSFNGNDAIEVKVGGVVTDVFGMIGDLTFWAGLNGVSAQNMDIQLKPGITTGATSGWTDPSSRFEKVSKSSLRGFGIAPGQRIAANNELLMYENFINSFGDWSTFNNGGNKNWFINTDGYAEINAFGGDANSDDWLVSPSLDLTKYQNINFGFQYDNFRVDNVSPVLPQFVISTDYDGVGNPANFTWTALYTLPAASGSNWEMGSVNLDSYKNASNVHIAIHYLGTPTSAKDLLVNDMIVTGDFKPAGAPKNLWVEKVTPSSPMVGVPFAVQVRLTDANGLPTVNNKPITVNLALIEGTGNITGTLTKTIPAGVNKVVFDNLNYSKAENIRVQASAPVNQNGYNIFLNSGDLRFDVMAKPLLSLYVYPKAHVGAINNVMVSVLSEYGLPNANYDGYNVTLTINGGTFTGSTTAEVKGGKATFNDLVFTSAGNYTVQASAPFLANSNTGNVAVIPMLSMTDVIVPKYVKTIDNTSLANFALVKFTGMYPNTVYRYTTGLVSSIPYNNDASKAGGNMMFKQWDQNYYAYGTYKFINIDKEYSTVMSDASGNAYVWLNVVSADFAGDGINEGTSYNWMVELGNPDGTFITRTFTTATATGISTGSNASQASGLYDVMSPNVTKGNFIVTYDQNNTPISSALVQGTGLVAPANNAPWFYHQNENGSWATIVPNTLAGGIRKIVEYNANGVAMNTWTDDNGVWAGYNTASASYGLNPPQENDPYRFALPKFQITYPGGGLGSDVCNEIDSKESINWASMGVGTFDMFISVNNQPYEYLAQDVNARDMAYVWDIQRNYLKNAQVQLKIVPLDGEMLNGNPFAWYSNVFHVFDAPMVTGFSKGFISCVNDSVTVLCTGEGSDLQYQWYKDGMEIPGATKDIYVINKIQHSNSGVYTCKVYNYHGCQPQWTGNIAVYTARGTSVIEQPVDQQILLGNKATFTFKAQVNGAPANHPVYNQYDVKVQWYKKTTSGDLALTDNDRIAGAKSNYMTITKFSKVDEGTYFARIWGLCGDWMQTNDVNLNQADIEMVTKPTDATTCEMTDASFTGEAQTNMNMNITYMWMKDGKQLLKGMKYDGINTNTLTVHNVNAKDAGVYTLVALLGTTGQTDQASATLTVNLLPSISSQPVDVKDVETAKPFTLEVVADGTNLTYQWYKDGAAINNETNSTFEVASAALTDAGDYYCAVINDCGTVNSVVAKVTVVTGNSTGVNDEEVAGYTLSAVTPNPVNESARLNFSMAQAGNVRISVIDALGNEVAVIADKFESEGSHNLSFNLSNVNLTSGAYYISMQAGSVRLAKSFVVVK